MSKIFKNGKVYVGDKIEIIDKKIYLDGVCMDDLGETSGSVNEPKKVLSIPINVDELDMMIEGYVVLTLCCKETNERKFWENKVKKLREIRSEINK